MSRRTAIDRPRLLNNAGEQLIADVYSRRSRKHSSWGDVSEILLRTLDATGLLRHYEEPGIDPLETIQRFNTDADS
jgi:hypothetical protein